MTNFLWPCKKGSQCFFHDNFLHNLKYEYFGGKRTMEVGSVFSREFLHSLTFHHYYNSTNFFSLAFLVYFEQNIFCTHPKNVFDSSIWFIPYSL
jgi:hypothetical protein